MELPTNPLLFLMAALAAVGLIFKVGLWVGGVNKDHAALKQITDEDRNTIKSFMVEIRNDIKSILLRLPTTPVATSSSPLRLTEFGEKIAKEAHASEIVAPHVTKHFAITGGLVPYDIQEQCDSYVRTQLYPELEKTNPEKVKILKKAAYENGVSLEQVFRVLALVMRDQILERSPQVQ